MIQNVSNFVFIFKQFFNSCSVILTEGFSCYNLDI